MAQFDPKTQIIVNGILHDILAEDAMGLVVRRPSGTKESYVHRLPDHPLYGSCRGVKIVDFPPRRLNAR